ncbi:MAG: DUF1801 domain-containing protein [Chthoniobacterales bacterium]
MNPKVDTFLKKAKKWQAEMTQLRAILLDCPFTEEIKWGKPCYTFQEGNVVILVGFKEHCALIFCKGALLKDPKGLLIKAGENTQAARQLRLKSVAEITKHASTLKAYFKEAIAVEKSGLEVKYKKITEFKRPDELEKKFKDSPALKEAFASLTPGRQRAYIMHFSAAKQSETRIARIEKCAPQILKGKGLNDDYKTLKK